MGRALALAAALLLATAGPAAARSGFANSRPQGSVNEDKQDEILPPAMFSVL